VAPGEVIAVASAGLSAVVAVGVSWLAFRFANRQEHIRWLRSTRVDVYQRMIAHSQACITWSIANARGVTDQSDTRRPDPNERRVLASEALLFSSDAVFQAWQDACPHELEYLTVDDWHDADVLQAGLDLIGEIRKELGVDSSGDALMRRC